MVTDWLGAEWTLTIIVVLAFALLITEAVRNDLVGVSLVVVLWATGLLDPEEALSGFSSEPAIVVAAIFVLTAALRETGVSESAGRWIGRVAGSTFTRMIAVLMPWVAALSAFTHHVATTGAMVPVALDLAEQRHVAASRLLMPVSFAASLGTTITIIGAPAFLIASAALQEAGQPGLGIFSIAPIGIALTVAGTLFMLGPGRWLLPERVGTRDASQRFRLASYLTEVKVLAGSPLLGRSSQEIAADDRYQMDVLGRMRDGERLPAYFEAGGLREGDVLVVRASADQLLQVPEEPGIELQPVEQYVDGAPAEDDDADPSDRLVQAVVAPNAEIVGSTIAEVDFRRRFDVVVVGLWRKSAYLAQELATVRLREGDVLVLQGDDEAIAGLTGERAFLMLVPFQGERRVRRKAPIAVGILLAAVVLAAFGMPLEMAMLAGAAAVVFTRCVTAGQAYRSIDQRIYVFIAGAIPLGIAMEQSGTSERIAHWFAGSAASLPPVVVLLALFVLVAIVTQFLSDSATTAVFAPVGIALAQALGDSPTAYVVTVAMSSVTAFLTPIGHHGNLLIYGAGGYRFGDFVRVGAPLTAICAIVVVFGSLLVWPL